MGKEGEELSFEDRITLLLLEATSAAQRLTFPLIQALMKEHGVEATDSPRRLVELLIPVIMQSKEIKMDASDPLTWYAFFGVGAPFYLPDSWEKLQQMHDFNEESKGQGIHIYTSPGGSSPEIAKQWVGCQIPFSTDIAYPMIFVATEMATAGLNSVDGKCFVVKAAQAMKCLQEQNPTGYEIVLRANPEWVEEGMHLIFNSDACNRITFEDEVVA